MAQEERPSPRGRDGGEGSPAEESARETLNALRARYASLEARAAACLSPKRWRHVEGVIVTAVRLALRWGVDAEKAYLAAALHDVAREMPRNRLLKATLDFGIVLSELEEQVTPLLHAPVGAAMARREFGIDDPDVLAAIRYHTTGRVGMSPLEKIIFLADYVEPGRSFPGVEKVRSLVWQDLDEALLVALSQSIVHLVGQGAPIAVDAVEARNHLLMQASRRASGKSAQDGSDPACGQG